MKAKTEIERGKKSVIALTYWLFRLRFSRDCVQRAARRLEWKLLVGERIMRKSERALGSVPKGDVE